MFTFTFITALVVTIFLINKKNEQSTTDESLQFEKKDSMIILGFLVLTLILNFVFKNYFPKIYFISAIISILPSFLVVTLVNANREKMIKNKQEQIIKIYEATSYILGTIEPENIDYNNVPFEYELDKNGSINKIIFDTSKKEVSSSDNTNEYVTMSLGKHFPDYQWLSSEDAPSRTLTFEGLPLPPKLANYPFSDYRPTTYVPIGISSKGELSWYITKVKQQKGVGRSQFQYDSGEYAKNVDVPALPQAMVLGGTGGGKSVYVNQVVDL